MILLLLIFAISACGERRAGKRQIAETESPQNLPDQGRERHSPPLGDSWPMLMYNISYRGESPDKTLRPPLSVAWKFKTGGPVNSSPVVADKTVYVGSDDHRLYALDSEKWGVKWEFEAGDKITYAPTVYKGDVYFSARDNKVYALSATTGTKKWEFQSDGWINAPVVAFDGRIYFGSYVDKIYVLSADTGDKLSEGRSRIDIGGVRYACVRGEFYPVDAHTRAGKWRQLLPPSESWPATANGVVYIGARDNKLHAFSLATRNQIWQFETDGWVDSSPAIASGFLYVGSRDGYIYAFANEGVPETLSSGKPAVSEGVVTRNRVDVYSQPNEATKAGIAKLNEGVSLPILDKKAGNWYLDPPASWFKVELPDGRLGWLNAPDLIPVKWSEDLQINTSVVKGVSRLKLPQGAVVSSWSPDELNIAFFDNISARSIYWVAESIWLAKVDGSDPKWVSNGMFVNPEVSWSGDGKFFAFENLDRTQRQVWIARSDGTGLKKVAIGEAPSVSPAGDKVAFIRRGKTATSVWIRNLYSGAERKVAEIPLKGKESYIAYGYTASLVPPSWSRDGSLLAVSLDGYHFSDNNSRCIVVSTSGALIKEISARAWRIRDAEWSPDGKMIAFVTQEHSSRQAGTQLDKYVHIAYLGSSNAPSPREEIFERSESIAWSPSGRYITFIEENETMGIRRKLWLLDTRKHQLVQLLSSRENIQKVFWLTDGKLALLAFPDPSRGLPRTLGWLISIGTLPK